MKFTLILACFALCVVYIEAQNNCRGAVPTNRQVCTGGRNEGNANNANCRRNANPQMWWYDATSRTCRTMAYRGCRGNNNRYCTLADCQARCIRRE